MGSRRWAGVPRRVRVIVAAAVVVFGYGTAVHVVQLFRGGADPATPPWLAAFFVSLTLLDPMVAILLALRRRAGLALAVVVLTTDALANGYANYVVDQAGGVTPGRIGQAVVTALAAALVLTASRIAPWLNPRPARPAESPAGKAR
jgi:hypothetical protein